MKEIICSGALIYSLTSKRFLFLYREKSKQHHLWGLVGGMNEETETPWTALQREIVEEIGATEILKSIPLETFISNDEKFLFHTYLCVVQNEFIPKLNEEHSGYAWVEFGKWPLPLHNGLKNTLSNKINKHKLKTIIQVMHLI
jgi:ADP-ribose pyrophosphatase YjhB (NUDIX family)